MCVLRKVPLLTGVTFGGELLLVGDGRPEPFQRRGIRTEPACSLCGCLVTGG